MSRFQPERWIFFPITTAGGYKIPFANTLTNILVTYRNGFFYIGEYTLLFKAAWERLGFMFLGRQLISELIEQRNNIKHEKYNARLRYHTYNTILSVKSCTDVLSLILRDCYKLKLNYPNTDLTKEIFREEILPKIETREIAEIINKATPWLVELYKLRVIIAHREALPMPFYRGEPPAREHPLMSSRPLTWKEIFQNGSSAIDKVPIQDFLEKYSDELTNLFQSGAGDFISLFEDGSVNVKNDILIPKVIIEFKGTDSDVFKFLGGFKR